MQDFKEAVQLAAKRRACQEALDELCKIQDWDEFFAHEEAPRWAYWYADRVLKGRWPEAEHVIIQDPHWACCYAEYVIEGRWLEAEPVIMREPRVIYWYAKDVIRGRWLEAEPVIARDPHWAQRYEVEFGVSLLED